MFPVTYKNRFIYTVQGDPSWAADKLRYHLYQGLKKEGAGNVHVRDRVIRFEGYPWYLGFRWHFFHVISKGKITVDYRDDHLSVVYQISFIDYCVIFLVLMGVLALISLGFAGSALLQGLGLFVESFCFFGLIIGGSITINCYRFNRFMKDRLREFFSSASSLGVQGELIVSR